MAPLPVGEGERPLPKEGSGIFEGEGLLACDKGAGGEGLRNVASSVVVISMKDGKNSVVPGRILLGPLSESLLVGAAGKLVVVLPTGALPLAQGSA